MSPVSDLTISSPVENEVRGGERSSGRALTLGLAVIALLIALTPFLSPSRRDLFPNDETRYSEVVREMRGPESLLVLRLDGKTYAHKPPLHFWLIYLFVNVLGDHSPWPYVLPSLLGFLLSLFIVRRLTLRIFGHGEILALIIFSTFYFVWGVSQIARMDSSFSALIALGMMLLWEFLQKGERRFLLLAAVSVGLAILTKGPMALIIVMVTLLFERIRGLRLPKGGYLTAVAICLAMPLLWLVPAGIIGGSRYLRELLIDQNVGRAMEAFIHSKPFWFYTARFPMIFFPWFFVLIVAAVATARRQVRSQADGALFCVSWFLAVFIPFSAISGKLDIYMLPAFVPAAVLLGGFLSGAAAPLYERIALIGNRALTLGIGFVFAAVALLPATTFHDPVARRIASVTQVREWLWWTAAFAVAAFALQFTVARRSAALTAALTAVAAIFPLVFVTVHLGPLVNGLQSTEALVTALEKQRVNWADVALVDAPYYWSSDMKDEAARSVHLEEEQLFRKDPPRVLVIDEVYFRKSPEMRRLLTRYRKVDSVRVRTRTIGIYRLQG